MKANSKVHRYLVELGFSYNKPSYSRLDSCRNIGEFIQIDKHNKGVTVCFGAFYPIDLGNFPIISPVEISKLTHDGSLSRVTSSEDDSVFWEGADLLEALKSNASECLGKVTNARLMIDALSFLSGESGFVESELSSSFPSLFGKPVNRVRSPMKLLQKAAYLNLAGDFSDSLRCLEMYGPRSNALKDKIYSDALAGEVQVSEELAVHFRRSA